MGMPEPIALRAFETPGNDTYLGVAQYQEIHAPIAQVAAVIDDYPHYPDLFDDLIRAEVRSNENGALVLFTEQRIPAPFVPNEENEMMYRIESVQANPSRAASKSYLYQLRSSKNLKFNDGLILLTQAGENLTIYSEIDFWDAEWGFIKSFGAKRIWASSLRALAQADLAIKLQAEHPEWDRRRSKKESEKQAQQIAVDPIYRDRLPVSAIFPETLSSPYPSASPSISPSSAHSQ